jgi:hypothetical protein
MTVGHCLSGSTCALANAHTVRSITPATKVVAALFVRGFVEETMVA